MLHDTEEAKLQDKMEYLNRDLTLMKQSLTQEQQLRTDLENKCATLTSNHRNLLSRSVLYRLHVR